METCHRRVVWDHVIRSPQVKIVCHVCVEQKMRQVITGQMLKHTREIVLKKKKTNANILLPFHKIHFHELLSKKTKKTIPYRAPILITMVSIFRSIRPLLKPCCFTISICSTSTTESFNGCVKLCNKTFFTAIRTKLTEARLK